MNKRAAAILLVLLASACGQGTNERSSITVTRFTQEGEGSVNSWIIEDDANRVVIDTQRAMSAGRQLSDILQRDDKPLRAILITHPHPDHFGGLGALVERFPDTPVLSSPTTQRIMQNDENGFIALTKQVLGDDAPDQQPVPSLTFEDGETLTWGSITLVADERGVGEADSMTVFLEPNEGYLFVGDVVDNGMTPFLMEGHTRQWLAQLEGMQSDYGSQDLSVFPGHGARTDTALFEEGEEMLKWVRSAVVDKLDGGITESEVDAIVDAFNLRYPNRPAVAAVPNLMHENVRAVAKELAAE